MISCHHYLKSGVGLASNVNKYRVINTVKYKLNINPCYKNKHKLLEKKFHNDS